MNYLLHCCLAEALFPAMPSIMDLYEPAANSMPVVDPSLKHFGRLWVPLRFVEPTKALRRWLSGIHQQPSLCLLHHTGQCNGGSKCNQAHINPTFMQEVRDALHTHPFSNCCLGHGDFASRRSDFQKMLKFRTVELKTHENAVNVLPEWLAVTAYFDCYMTDNSRQQGPLRCVNRQETN